MNLKPLKEIAIREQWSRQKLKTIRGQILKMTDKEAEEFIRNLERKEK